MAAPNTFGDLNLSIVGLAAEYPPHSLPPKALEILAEKFYPDTAA